MFPLVWYDIYIKNFKASPNQKKGKKMGGGGVKNISEGS